MLFEPFNDHGLGSLRATGQTPPSFTRQAEQRRHKDEEALQGMEADAPLFEQEEEDDRDAEVQQLVENKT